MGCNCSCGNKEKAAEMIADEPNLPSFGGNEDVKEKEKEKMS